MSGKRRSNRLTNFHFEYTIHNFAALETKEDSAKEDDVNEKWKQTFLGSLLETNLRNLDLKDLSRNYDGDISISLKSLKQSSVVIGQDTLTKFQPYKSGSHGPLSDAVFEFGISLKGLFGKTRIGLLALLKKGQIDSYSRLGIDMYDLARKVDRLPKEIKEKCRLSTNQLASINKVGSILQPIFNLLGLEAALKNGTDQKRAEMLVNELLQTIEEDNIHNIQFRTQLANYLEMYKEAMKYAPSLLREKKIDVETIETFAKDFFIIFRHYMNLVIRFFKYDCQQYWLQEIPESVGGYFYFTNEIFMDNKGPLIPIARHHHTSDMLSEEYLISENDWLGIRETIGNYEQLVQRAGDFTLGGIFSQSDIQLEEDHLENAVILGLVGLEAAMTQTLEYFYGERGADGTAGKKLARVIRLLKNANFPNMTLGEFDSMYGLIAGTENETEADGLLPLRNDVMHNGRTIPKGNKRIVVEYISASRRFAYRLINWIKSTPDKNIAPSLKGKKRRTRSRT